MTTPKSHGTTNGLSAASKKVVSSTREWASTVREVTLAPMVELMDQHPSTGPMVKPWVEMTRTTQDWLWSTWEETAGQLIERTCSLLDRPTR